MKRFHVHLHVDGPVELAEMKAHAMSAALAGMSLRRGLDQIGKNPP